MGRAQYRLRKHVREEQSKIEKAGAKRGLWSKIGMALGGLVAIGLTGGAAAPAVVALAAGTATAAGGFAGRQLAAKSKGGKIRGGKFFQDERESLISQIDQDILAGAGKSALGAGMTALGGSLSLGKEGLKLGKIGSVGKDGSKLNLANLWDKGKTAATAPGTYSDSLWGKLGQAIDYKGSFIGKGIGNRQSWQTGRELQGMG